MNDLIRHFVEGTGSDEDVEQVDRWISSNPDSHYVVNRFVESAALRNLNAPDANEAFGRIRAKVHSIDVPGRESKQQYSPKALHLGLSVKSFRYVFATGLALTLAFVAGWQLKSAQKAHIPINVVGSTYSTAAGQRATVVLPDQSEVILNASSRLETSSDYSDGNRIVYLKGEAVFTVRHHQDATFTVISENGKTEVLGTKFLVRRYQTDSVTTVIVKDGKVRVAGNTTLTAGEQAVFAAPGMVVMQPAEFSRFAFVDGVLNLPEMRISDALVELNRWYDVDIRLTSASLESRTIGGEFTSGSIGDLISFLKLILDVDVRRNGRILTLSPRDA